MLERLYTQDASTELGYKDRRSFKSWCENNGVEILSDKGSNRRYVLKQEFEEAMSRKGAEYLKSREGKVKKENRYQPMGEHELKFLSILTGKSAEL